MTQQQVDAHNAKVALGKGKAVSATAYEGKESDLHRQIEEDIKKRRWLFIHSRTDRATTTAKGVPDFICFPGHGKVFFIEVKTKTGKLSAEQRAWQYCAGILGYDFYVIRSFVEWLQIAEEK